MDQNSHAVMAREIVEFRRTQAALLVATKLAMGIIHDYLTHKEQGDCKDAREQILAAISESERMTK